MMDYINIFIKSVFVENMVFSFFLGMCSYLAVSKTVKTATGLGLAVIFVLAITLPLNYLLYEYVLKAGALTWLSPNLAGVDLSFLSYIVYIAMIATFVQIVEMFVEKFSPGLYSSLGIFLPLIAVNCAETTLPWPKVQRRLAQIIREEHFYTQEEYDNLDDVDPVAIREKLAYSNVPKPLKGLGLAFIITGLMGIAFMSFMGFQL